MDTDDTKPPQGNAHAQSDGADVSTSPHTRWVHRVCPRDQDGNPIGEPLTLVDTKVLQKRDGGLVVGG